MTPTDTHTDRRIFVKATEPLHFLAELERPQGRFIPTRVVAHGRARLAVRIAQAARPIEIEVHVIGRRLRPAEHGAPEVGIVVHLAPEGREQAALLRDLATGRVVDADDVVHDVELHDTTARFTDPDEATGELHRVLDGDDGWFPLSPRAVPRDLVFVNVYVDDVHVGHLKAEVRGIADRDGVFSARLRPLEPPHLLAPDLLPDDLRSH